MTAESNTPVDLDLASRFAAYLRDGDIEWPTDTNEAADQMDVLIAEVRALREALEIQGRVRVAWINLQGQQGEPAGEMVVTASLADGSEIELIRDNGNIISHSKNVRGLFAHPAPHEKITLARQLAERGADKAGCDGWRAQEMCRQIADLLSRLEGAK